jgi:hypothetical protein
MVNKSVVIFGGHMSVINHYGDGKRKYISTTTTTNSDLKLKVKIK